jgi:tetratricopeptide (TPR) repeat protein
MQYIYRAYQLTPDKPHIWDSLAWGHYKQGELDKALSYAEKAADTMPYSALVQSHLGDIYLALGRNREAKYQYNKALNLKEDMTDKWRYDLTQKLSAR